MLAKWWATMQISWSKQLAYKLNFLLLVVGPTAVFCFVKFNLWKAIFSLQDVSTVGSYSQDAMLTYQLWTMIVAFLAQGYQNMNLAEDIRLGRISTYLIYPFDFWSYHTASFLAFQVLQVLVAAVTLGFLYSLGFIGSLDGGQLGMGLLFSLYVSLFWYQLSFLIGLAAFWLEETWVLRVMLVTVAQFLSGAVLPLELFPAWLADALSYTPFPLLTYVPVKIFMGTYGGDLDLAYSVLSFWLVGISLLLVLVWRRGMRLYTAAGM